jgi:hypothetical protein
MPVDLFETSNQAAQPNKASPRDLFAAMPQDTSNPYSGENVNVPMFDALKTMGEWMVPGGLERKMVGLGRGLTDVGEGIKQKFLQAKEFIGAGNKGDASQYQKEVDQERKFYQSTPYGQSSDAKLARLAAQTAPYMAIPGGVQGSLLRRMLTGGLGGTTTGALQYVPEGGSGLLNTVLGGTIGSSAPLLMKALTKGYNTIEGNYADPAQEELINLGKQHNVPVYAPDIAKSRTIQGAGRALEEVPFIGMQGERKAQMMAAKDAAENVVGKAKTAMDDTAFGGLTGMRKIEEAAKQGGIRGASAKSLLDDIKASGDDWNRIMQTSGNVNLFRSKIIADQKYNKVAEMADGLGSVPTVNAAKAVDGSLKDLSSGQLVPDDKTISILNKIKENLSQPFNYSQLRNARGQVGSLIDDYFKGTNAAVGSRGVGYLQSIKQALGSDLDSFAQSANPQLKTAWKNADNFYRNAVAPAKDKLLANALKEANPDEVYSKFIGIGAREGGKGTGRAQTFYKALDNKGKAAVKYGMVSDAFEKAYKRDADQFSPALFASELDRHAAAKGVFFKGADKVEIDGFKNLMRHVERSAQAINKPDTGVRAIPYLIAGGALPASYMAPGTTLTAAGVTYGIKKLFTTDAGKRFLFSASTLKPGSEGLQKAANILQRIFQQSAVLGATQPSDQ